MSNRNLVVLLLLLLPPCQAAPFLSATSSISFYPKHQVFHKGDGAGVSGVRGFVRLAGGFTILPDASALFDTFVTVSGPIDLRETGTLTLLSNLSLGSNVTLSSGGMINGRGQTIILNGNLTLPSNKILHFRSNTIIDGRGHTLTIGDYAQLFVDSAMTLTLQNMVLKSGPKTAIFPPVRCAATTSQLVLDNVIFEPQSDIPFYQGQLWIYDSVLFTGTSALVYTSPQSSFITPGATLAFDKSTTFSFAPATTSKDLIQMQDVTSRIILDGATLKCTDTGMHLITGQLLCDNKVSIDTMNGFYFSTVTATTWVRYGGTIYSVAWRPDGKYVAIGGRSAGNGAGGFSDTNELRLYSFNGTILTPIISKDYGDAPSAHIRAMAWSFDGKYLAIGGYSPVSGYGGFNDSNELRVYSFNGTTLTAVTSQDYGYWISSVSWSPDSKYLAIGGLSPTSGYGGFNDSNELRLYSFNGTTLIPITSKDCGSEIYSLSWSPDGKYLAIGGTNNNSFLICQFNGVTLTTITTQSYSSSYSKIFSMAWNTDGQYLAVGGYNSNNDNLQVYRFNGSILSLITIQSYSHVGEIDSAIWSPNGKYLAIGGSSPASGYGGFNDTNELRLYSFNGSTLTPISSKDYGSQIYSLSWSPDGKYLVIGGYSSTTLNNSQCQIYAPVLGANPNPQALTNSLVFGNSSLGSSANLNVKILGAANVEVRGKVLDDSV